MEPKLFYTDLIPKAKKLMVIRRSHAKSRFRYVRYFLSVEGLYGVLTSPI